MASTYLFLCVSCGNEMVMYRDEGHPGHWLLCRCGEAYVVFGYCQVPTVEADGG